MEKDKETKELEQRLQENIAFAVWLQVIGQVLEAINLSKLYNLTNDPLSDVEKGILTGAWVQTIGDIVVAIGTTAEVLSDDPQLELQAQIVATQGLWIQTFGTGMEASIATETIKRELQSIPAAPFISIPDS
ncbi:MULTISPECIES: hypothetical protein [unclassified Sutcliffiella]|uniref:hypothetical protein n=1 Tax=unclassified Sutcliffiella TaxID=2837532 RepID=UPI0030D4A2EA